MFWQNKWKKESEKKVETVQEDTESIDKVQTVFDIFEEYKKNGYTISPKTKVVFKKDDKDNVTMIISDIDYPEVCYTAFNVYTPWRNEIYKNLNDIFNRWEKYYKENYYKAAFKHDFPDYEKYQVVNFDRTVCSKEACFCSMPVNLWAVYLSKLVDKKYYAEYRKRVISEIKTCKDKLHTTGNTCLTEDNMPIEYWIYQKFEQNYSSDLKIEAEKKAKRDFVRKDYAKEIDELMKEIG